jgi:hypothetical protein
VKEMAKHGSNDEITEFFYGINLKTFAVESVSKTRGGRLSKSLPDGTVYSQMIAPGKDAQSEVVIMFGLTDVVRIPAIFWSSEFATNERQKLEEKATVMKKAAAAKKSAGES